jgi:hypothetical protein
VDTRSLWNRIPAAFRLAVIAVVVVGLLLFTWFYGVKAWNGVGNWIYHHSENDGKKEITKIKTELAAETKIANQAVAVYEASKLVIEEERKKREQAEIILADRSKTTDQKLAAYQAAVNSIPTVTPPQSTDELCARAKALGLKGCD